MKTLILILSSLAMISCKRLNKIDSSDAVYFFDPEFDIDISDLKTRGYHYVKDWSWYQKSYGDTTFIYGTQHEEDPIFTRIVSISNWRLHDTVKIRQFIESKHGSLKGPIYDDDGVTKFFAQGQKSGLYSQGFIFKGNLQIVFHYPDHGGGVRSKFRRPTEDGFVTEFGDGNTKYSTKAD